MPICTKCKNKWSWKQTVKKTATLNPEMSCPHCGEKQYQSKKSKALIPFFGLLPLLPLLIQAFFDVSVIILLSLIPLLIVIVFVLYPFLIKLSSEEEFPF